MFFSRPLSFVEEFVDALDAGLKEHDSDAKLSQTQKDWLCFCLMGILVTNSVCWARFERASLGDYSLAAISAMFRKSPFPWEEILQISIDVILRKYNINEGIIVADDTDNKRAKVTKNIYRSHKVYDKKTGGYFNGQSIVFIILVSNTVTLPVGFSFYYPDPAIKAWEKEEEKLKKEKIPKSDRPDKPERNPDYPTKLQLTQELIKRFSNEHPKVKINAVIGDNHFSKADYMDKVGETVGTQVISQLKTNQKVRIRGKEFSVEEFFKRYSPTEQIIKIRGEEEQKVWVGSARLYVPSHQEKRFVIALKYEGEDNYRYLVASDLSWRTIDVVESFTLRWLVEVFFEDFKSYEGWGQLAKQPGVEGSIRGLTLSLLLDHCLLLHPSQEASFENKLPAATVGSLLQKARAEALFDFLQPFISDAANSNKLMKLGQSIENIYELQPSKKHMNGRILGRQKPTSSLKYRNLQKAV
jgi:hypothetical protein